MKHITKRYQTLILLTGLIGLFISCNNDFVDINSDLVNEEVATIFNLDSIEYDVIAYTMPLGPVQSNNLELNHIGVYKDEQFGVSNYNFLSQIIPESFDPEFGDDPVIDSVTLYIPYFSTNTGTDDDGNRLFSLDSVYGNDPINFSVFESTYFLRNFDPEGEVGDLQNYYTNKSASEDELISDNLLESTRINLLVVEEDEVVSKPSIPVTASENGIPQDSVTTLSPGLYVKLETEFWKTKILDQ